MSDLSHPTSSLLPVDGGYAWPTPEIAGYPAADDLPPDVPCSIEGLNGHTLDGRLALFDPHRGLLQLRMQTPRRPLQLRMDQFRRIALNDLLCPVASPDDGRQLSLQPAPQDFRIQFRDAPAWQGQTLGHRYEGVGLFLFEPVDAQGGVRRWFVPRAAYLEANVGPRIGEALVQEQSATPEQIRQALAEQEQLRSRRIGDMLVVKQIISGAELARAIEHQARMPMVRIGEALTSLGYITEAQLEQELGQQRNDRCVPLGELLLQKGMIKRDDLQTALARKMGYPLVDVLHFAADADAVARVPYVVASRIPALPLMLRAGRLVAAVEDPSNRSRIDELEYAAQCKVVPVLARPGALPGAIERAYGRGGAAV